MDGGTLYSIGELARHTGLTVKQIRFYSDRGVVPPSTRTPNGYRQYGPEAAARLALVRTLRELGLGLDVIRQILHRERDLAEVAAEHAAALETQIEVLRLRRALLTAVAGRAPAAEELDLMHRLAALSTTQRRSLVDEFLDAVFRDLDDVPAHAAARRSLTPELPDVPTDEQLAAWVELAELSLAPEFRTLMRHLAEAYAADLPDGGATPPRPDVVAVVRDHASAAIARGTAPDSPAAAPVVATLAAACARTLGRPDDTALRVHLLQRLDTVRDARRERYVRLLAVLNGWPEPEPLAPALDWSVRALRAQAAL